MNIKNIFIVSLITLIVLISYNFIKIIQLKNTVDDLTIQLNNQKRNINSVTSDFEKFKKDLLESNEEKTRKIRNIEFETEINKNEQELQNNTLENKIYEIEKNQY